MDEEISDEQMEDDLSDCVLDRIGAKAASERDPTFQEEIAQTHVMDAGAHRVPVYISMIKSLRSKVSELETKNEKVAEIWTASCKRAEKAEAKLAESEKEKNWIVGTTGPLQEKIITLEAKVRRIEGARDYALKEFGELVEEMKLENKELFRKNSSLSVQTAAAEQSLREANRRGAAQDKRVERLRKAHEINEDILLADPGLNDSLAHDFWLRYEVAMRVKEITGKRGDDAEK